MRCMGYLERAERMWVMKVAIMSVRGVSSKQAGAGQARLASANHLTPDNGADASLLPHPR